MNSDQAKKTFQELKELLYPDQDVGKDTVLKLAREEGLLSFKESEDLRFKLQQVK